jgi:hypothetical protein
MACGFLYLVAIIDWASLAVLAWRLSNTNDAGFRCRWRCGAPVWTKTRRRRGLWMCRFAWDNVNALPTSPQHKQQEAA